MEYGMYNDRINKLEELMENSLDYKAIKTEIDELYCYKPVSMRLLALKSKLLNSNNKSVDVIRDYGDLFSVESIEEDNIALWEQVIVAYDNAGMKEKAIRQIYMKNRLLDSNYISDLDIVLNEVKSKFSDGDESLDVLNKLEDLYFETYNTLLAYCIFLYKSKVYNLDIQDDARYSEYGNRGYFNERIENGCKVTIVAIEEDKTDYDILVYILHKLGVSVYMITDVISLDEEFDLKASVVVSVENKQEFDDCIIIPAIEKVVDNKNMGNNIPYIIDYISRDVGDEDFSLVIACNEVIEKLKVHQGIAKRFDRLSEYDASYLEDKIGFGWSGDYYEYIGYVYGINVKEYVERNSSIKYSIVVPARNATKALYYTLKTCIEQDYDGEYEIVLSDNSTDGDMAVYNTYKEINNAKIQYYKTPRDLNLTKSFEYALLQTKGEYIIPIGADDAMLPWALKCIEAVWNEKNTHRNVLCWDRGFYAWPGFNGGQENQFVIPSFYKKNNIEANIYTSRSYINAIKKNPAMMYSLPNLYLNSGFKRSYLKKIYNYTGRLWDGYSQDIYVGIQNLGIENEFLYISFPITIAGMSNASLGALNSSFSNNNEKKDELSVRSGGKYIYYKIVSGRERLMPITGDDVCGMYLCIEHLISKGILKKEFYGSTDEVKDIYIKCFSSMSYIGDKYMKHVYDVYESVKKQGIEVQIWFEQHILPSIKKIKFYDEKEVEEKNKMKRYEEGYNSNGGITLDASRYGVSNIYEATKLFKGFLHF